MLSGAAVHVWSVRLDVPPDADSLQLLSSGERERAQRFRRPQDRDRFVRAHAALRRLLGAYLALPAHELRFDHGPQGKPSLDASTHPDAPRFNLSHAAGLALVAITRAGDVGADVERVRPLDDLEDIAERFFSPAERQALLALDPGDRTAAFFRCWTRKEAFIKARGDGLSRPLDSFQVPLDASATVTADFPFRVRDLREPGARWPLAPLEPANGYVGAVVVSFESPILTCRHLDD